jgi:hypothetical protein
MARSVDKILSALPYAEGAGPLRRFKRMEVALLKAIHARETDLSNRLIWLWLSVQLRSIENGREMAEQLYAEWIGLCD